MIVNVPSFAIHLRTHVLQSTPYEASQKIDVTRGCDRLVRPAAMPIISVRLALRRATAGSVHPANTIPPHRGCAAWQARPLRPRPTTGSCKGPLHGVVAHSDVPPPRRAMLPTMACPPSLTVTCSTVTRCSPPVRYRLPAPICWRYRSLGSYAPNGNGGGIAAWRDGRGRFQQASRAGPILGC